MFRFLRKFFKGGVSVSKVITNGRGKNTCNINGIKITGNYKTIVSRNGKIFLDGKEYIPEEKDEKYITIIVQGDVEKIEVDEAQRVEIHGNVKSDVKTMSGNVVVNGNIEGMAKTMSGDIECKILKGRADTMSGDITYKGRD